MINKFVFMLASIVIPIITIFYSFSNNNYIDWDENYKLKYSDFKGNAIKSKLPSGKIALKITYTITEYDDEPPIYKLANKFDQNNSWLSMDHTELLNEYQFIWNLHELYTRKARKEIKELNDKNVLQKSDYEIVIGKNLKRFEKERKKYDGILQNQKDFSKILNKQYQDSLNIYNNFKK